MNYQKLYNALIENAKNKNFSGYIETHHILPKCLGGSNDKENLVRFTAREHFIAHRLLIKIYKDDAAARKKMIYSYWIMSNRLKQISGASRASRTYENARLLFSMENPQKCIERQKRVSEKRKAGLYNYDYSKVSATLKQTLSKLSKEELNERQKNSAGKCDQVARAEAIKKGKSSFLKAIIDGEIIEFHSYEAKEKTGFEYHKIKYFIKKNLSGYAPTGEYFEYIKKYTGGNKWKNKQLVVEN